MSKSLAFATSFTHKMNPQIIFIFTHRFDGFNVSSMVKLRLFFTELITDVKAFSFQNSPPLSWG